MSEMIYSGSENCGNSYGFPKAGKIENDWRRWGFLEVFLGLVFGHILAAFAYVLVQGIGGYEDFAEYPLWLVSVANFPLQASSNQPVQTGRHNVHYVEARGQP